MSPTSTVDHGLRRLNLGIFLMLSASATSGYNASQINSLLVLPEFTKFLSGLDSNSTGLIIASVSLGSFLSFIPASYVADRLGRRKCVLIGATLCILASILQVAVKHHWVFFGARIVTGAGVGFSQTAAPLLIAETAHPSQRPTLTGLYNAVWFCGSITAAAIAFSTLSIENSWSWRVPCLLQILYPTMQLVALTIIPESPRWLVSKSRQGEALAMLTRYHANGDMHDKLVQDEYDQICASIHAEADQKSASRWSAFFRSKGDIHRLTICILLGFMQEWTGNGVTSYYLPPILASVGITNATHQAAVNISLQFWNLIFAVTGASTSDKYGRRVLWLCATTLMLIFLTTSTVMAGLFAEMNILEAGIAVVPMLFLFCAAYDFAYMPLFIAYPAEILPFQLRAKGLAVTLTTDSLACFFNQYVNPVAFSVLRWRYFSIYVGCLVIVLGLVYFFFPETQGRSLEEVARIFESPKVKDHEALLSDSDGSKQSSFVIKYEE
ncbi:Lactose permease [Penicillium rolfsii]|nr:Lactose permease [Penicillium rolfsii]